MNKKGFTLVELLAVIVILAIMTLITIPIIGNVIEKAKIGALESSVNGLVESANMYYANETIKGDIIEDVVFDFEKGEQISEEKLSYKGRVYNGKLILTRDSEVITCIDDGKYYAYKEKESDEIKSGIGTCVYDGTTGDFIIESDTEVVIKKMGLIEYIGLNKFENNSYEIIEINNINYAAHIYNFDGDQVWDSNKIFGDENDVANETEYAKNMVIVKVNGNLTIEENVKVEPYYTEYGGPKGFLLYVTGHLINNGIIDNSHGAKAIGENVYLYGNDDGSYEYIPATGSAGGSSISNSEYHNGNDGIDAIGRSTAGGGAGGFFGESNEGRNGAGAAGTSYSGGSGGGASGRTTAEDAKANGGKGGDAGSINVMQYNGGGAGNPGGKSSSDRSTDGLNGTGGLLIIYANNITNNANITAEGYDGGYGQDSSGGGSGGGSINIFCGDKCTVNGNISVKGGSSSSPNYSGGSGGNGSISVSVGYVISKD